MDEIRIILGWAAGALSLAAFVPYILSILRGETIPNRATWFIWTVVGVMLGSSYYAGGANNTMWLPASYVVGPFVVFLLSIKRGEGGWTKLDRVCLSIAGVSAFFWGLTGSAFVALCMNLVADAMGAFPTILKAYHKPESEDRMAWTMAFVATIVNIGAVENWHSFSIWGYPIYMLLNVGTIAALLWFRARKKM